MGRKKYFVDRKGKPITKGCKVKWYDPDEQARDLSRIWEVYRMGGEIVYLADKYGEAEVLPCEVEIVA